jgi:ribosome small subunit-dependent GTPase A
MKSKLIFSPIFLKLTAFILICVSSLLCIEIATSYSMTKNSCLEHVKEKHELNISKISFMLSKTLWDYDTARIKDILDKEILIEDVVYIRLSDYIDEQNQLILYEQIKDKKGQIKVYDEVQDKEYLEAWSYLYRSIGYNVIEVSAATGEGIDKLKESLENKITLLSGNSGVGKSTIINQIIPGLNLRTAEISTTHDTGMHTTTFSEMFPLPNGGYLIDTPGVKGFGTIDFDRHEVAHFFPEIFEIAQDCRFGDCTHTHEPGCAVLQALEESKISQSRYNSYLSILEDSSDDKYRKAF